MGFYANAKVMNSAFLENAVSQNTPRVVSYPEKLTIFLTNRCNYNCVMCSEGKEGDIDKDIFDKLKPALPFVRDVTLLGGEPLLYKHVDEVLRLLGDYECRPAFITNGSLLDAGIAKTIVASSVERVTVSIDAASPKTYAHIRRGGNFMRVVKNLATLAKEKAKARASRPRITLNFAAMRTNIDELPRLVQLASELGAEQVSAFHTLISNPNILDDSLFFCQEQSNQKFLEAKALGEQLGVCVTIPPLFGHDQDQTVARKRCSEPWKTLLVRISGDVCSCCRMERYGNLLEDPFDAIWNSEIIARYRSTVNTPQELDTCRHCHMLMKAPNVDLLETHFGGSCLDIARQRVNVPA